MALPGKRRAKLGTLPNSSDKDLALSWKALSLTLHCPGKCSARLGTVPERVNLELALPGKRRVILRTLPNSADKDFALSWKALS